MTDQDTNHRRFLDAFADIEGRLAEQQNKRQTKDDWTRFYELVEDSDELLPWHKHALRGFAKLRNAISHNRHLNRRPIADPRWDAVEEIEHIRELLLRPPKLIDALSSHGKPRVFDPQDDVQQFLELVTEHDFSQSPVKTTDGYQLITTNAVARWFAANLIQHGGLVDSAPIQRVLDHAETGDRLRLVNPGITTVKAINIFSGQDATEVEPPAALLVSDIPGRPPQSLCSRADLTALYAQLAK